MPKSLPLVGVVLFGFCVAGWNARTAAQSADVAPRVLVDFRKVDPPDTLRLRAEGAKTERAKDEAGSALAVTTEADAPYPGVYIEPPQGKWDLSAFDGGRDGPAQSAGRSRAGALERQQSRRQRPRTLQR